MTRKHSHHLGNIQGLAQAYDVPRMLRILEPIFNKLYGLLLQHVGAGALGSIIVDGLEELEDRDQVLHDQPPKTIVLQSHVVCRITRDRLKIAIRGCVNVNAKVKWNQIFPRESLLCAVVALWSSRSEHAVDDARDVKSRMMKVI